MFKSNNHIRFVASALVLAFALSQPFVLIAKANIAPANSPKPYSRKPSKEALKWADTKLRKMSLDEKIGQLIYVGVNATFLNQDSEAFKALRHQVVDNHVGGIILFRGPVYESVVLVNRMQQLAGLGMGRIARDDRPFWLLEGEVQRL